MVVMSQGDGFMAAQSPRSEDESDGTVNSIPYGSSQPFKGMLSFVLIPLSLTWGLRLRSAGTVEPKTSC
jgi:hypothetical protein